MTTARWWAPTEPHLGPDEIDLAMLAVEGGNSRLDLGGVLLAAHRVGDAACQEAASRPICDENTLIESLAGARARLADPMVDSVSKCVSEGGSYAGLLVMDVLDAADRTAVELFSAARSRGVAGPLAAARAGAIYGVPSSELGQYRTLALDPKANQVALTDTADRAVFKYFAELAEQETTQVVAKATEQQPRSSARIAVDEEGHQYYDVRDGEGRFSATLAEPTLLARLRGRYGIGNQVPPKVASGRPSEQVVVPPKPAEPEKATPVADRVAEFQRKQRLLNETDERPRRKRAVPERAKPERARQERSGPSRKTRERLRLRDEQAANAIIPDKTEPAFKKPAVPKAEFRAPERGHHLLDKVPDDDMRGYERLDDPVAVVIPLHEARYLNSEGSGSPGRLFRVHHLLGLAINPNGPHDLDDQDGLHAEALDDLTSTADGTHAIGQAQLHGKRRDAAIARDGDNRIDETFRMSAARQHGDETGKRTVLIPAADDSGDYWAVTRDPGDALPLGFEYVLHGANAAVDWSERAARNETSMVASSTAVHDYRVDPNQAFQLPEATAWQKVYDPDRGIVIQRINVHAVNEDAVTRYRRGDPPIAKAVEQVRQPTTQVRPDDPETPWWDARDQGGRFSSGSAPGLLAQVREKHGITVQPKEQRPVPEAPTKLTPDQFRSRETLLNPEQRTRKKPQRAAPERARPDRERVIRCKSPRDVRAAFTRMPQLTEQGQKREQIQRRIEDEIAPLRSRLALNLDHQYRVMDGDELDDIRADNATIPGLKDGVIRVRKSSSIEDLEGHQVTGRRVWHRLRASHWDVQSSVDGQQIRIQTYPTETAEDQTALNRVIQNKLFTGEHGMIARIPNDKNAGFTDVGTPYLRAVNGESTQLHMSLPPAPINLIEFDPGAAAAGGDYDLIPLEQESHIDSSTVEDEDYTGGVRHHYYMIVNRWLAVNPSETQSVLDAIERSRYKDEGER